MLFGRVRDRRQKEIESKSRASDSLAKRKPAQLRAVRTKAGALEPEKTKFQNGYTNKETTKGQIEANGPEPDLRAKAPSSSQPRQKDDLEIHFDHLMWSIWSYGLLWYQAQIPHANSRPIFLPLMLHGFKPWLCQCMSMHANATACCLVLKAAIASVSAC